MPVYAHCFHCGHDFESNAYNLQQSVGTQIVGVQETCPNCGRLARVMEGQFSFIGPDVTIHNAPQWSRDLVFRLSKAQAHRLKTTVAWAQQRVEEHPESDERAAQAVEKSLEENAPAVLRMLDALGGRRGMAAAAWLGVLIAVVMLLLQIFGQSGGEFSEDDVQQVVEETVRAYERQQSPEVPVETTPEAPHPEPGQPGVDRAV